MKIKFNEYTVKKVIMTVVVLLVIGVVGYLFVYDLNRPERYVPEMDTEFLKTEIDRIAAIDADSEYTVYDEDDVLVTQDGFKCILSYSCERPVDEETKDSYDYLEAKDIAGKLIRLSDSVQIFVWDAYYKPIVEALGYGWLNYDGNLYASNVAHYSAGYSADYADKNRREATKDKPNYRNCFRFTIIRDDELFVFLVYCNTDSAEEALSESINYINNNVLGVNKY